jgi:protein-S-isoprenylcysteine O-methyltransferase Ste14
MAGSRTRGGQHSFLARFSASGSFWVLAHFPMIVLAVMVPRWTGTNAFDFAHPLDWIGAPLSLGGMVVIALGLLKLGRYLTPFNRPRTKSVLETGGVFAWFRHPVYAGIILGSLGWGLWWKSWVGLGFTLVVFWFYDRKVAHEEQWLRRQFSDYDAYARRVKKFIPAIY